MTFFKVSNTFVQLMLLAFVVGMGFVAMDRSAPTVAANDHCGIFSEADPDCDGSLGPMDPEPYNPCVPSSAVTACTSAGPMLDDDGDGSFAYPWGPDWDDADGCVPFLLSPTCGSDQDGDGFGPETDCDDTDPLAYPGADEVPYDGVDQDCDGSDLTDVDGDGYDGEMPDDGVEDDIRINAVHTTESHTEIDCDDTDPDIHPGATEISDGIDNNCDGVLTRGDRLINRIGRILAFFKANGLLKFFSNWFGDSGLGGRSHR